ncbi:fatty acyl-CoA hydrolase precursor, medium chain-like [Saccostrea echinata]|uniref:fatty acyl-CoA hydrolase precursor, medium chain-like n=1 Tax=Saccostrea echinata TaxID=191078 RepID=UPI002A8395D1|nr:fatty acyl-CoA hydrolase precursor, medium chain-like [Saccostrea echinata]XP_061181629.1 fatty acyl-CoA hydrolase precursor, medium chain-like [Saccostrea echinata]XP_061181630.1 fatty acyl-CoA hydrolase precursor, medium chain-like [Saccostrea echinata]XP_061181631.1 fatty acyl-CoA hydrolase precursor, medium chain-like [Saccostrea echinata]
MKIRLMMVLVLIAVLCLSNPVQAQSKRVITLQTSLGNITGFVDFRNARIFYNIPYGKSPIGSRKFAKPEPYGKWSGNRDGRDPSPLCPQPRTKQLDALGLRMDEDCLILNIYTPINSIDQIPVMVWIHGGGYVAGGAIQYDGSALATVGNVVVVTVNYRLGLEGFLSFGDNLVKGNYGIWDQILALRWVKDNIKDYGGNPNEVTIFGESAGGMSVSQLSLIPSNKGLFKRAIMQSGVANSLFAFQYGPRESHRAISDQLGCPYDEMNTTASLNCMRQINTSSIINVTADFFSNTLSSRLSIGPVIDGELFKRSIEKIFANNNSEELEFLRSLDVMIGTTDSDGSLIIRMSESVQKEYGFNISDDGLPYQFFCDMFIPSLVNDYYKGNAEVSDALCKMYGKPNDQAENSRHAVKMYGDIFFLSPAMETLTVHAKNNNLSKTYQYVFSEWSLPVFFDATVFPPWFEGAGHATELIYLFFLEFLPMLNPELIVNPADHNFAKNLRIQWTNFAKYGNPNGAETVVEDWPQFDTTERKFMQLNKNNMTVGVNYRGDKIKFFSETVPVILRSTSSASFMCVYFSHYALLSFLVVLLRNILDI